MGAILRTRAFDCEVRAESNEKHGNYITGRAIVFNSVTDMGYFDEVIEPGALDEADLRDVRMLINHDTKMVPVARSRNNNANSTLQLTVNDQGMDIRADLDTENNPDAKKLYSGVSRGDISGMSFMFYIKEQKWERMDTDHPLRRILKIEIRSLSSYVPGLRGYRAFSERRKQTGAGERKGSTGECKTLTG